MIPPYRTVWRMDVALLAEGVDRNSLVLPGSTERPGVALLAEGVDRNIKTEAGAGDNPLSPSSRRAWIEMPS